MILTVALATLGVFAYLLCLPALCEWRPPTWWEARDALVLSLYWCAGLVLGLSL